MLSRKVLSTNYYVSVPPQYAHARIGGISNRWRHTFQQQSLRSVFHLYNLNPAPLHPRFLHTAASLSPRVAYTAQSCLSTDDTRHTEYEISRPGRRWGRRLAGYNAAGTRLGAFYPRPLQARILRLNLFPHLRFIHHRRHFAAFCFRGSRPEHVH